MSELSYVAEIDEIPVGTMRCVEVGGEPVTVANVDGVFFAFSDTCTHDGAPLSEGDLEGERIICPWHFSCFDVKTGQVLESPAEEPISTFSVRVEGTAIKIDVASGE